MNRWTHHLETLGPVVRFDYPYMQAGKKRPDPLPRLLEAHRAQLEEGIAQHGPHVVLVGKSMGGRVGCHLAPQERVLGVVCLGYPLVGMGKSRKVRDQVLLDLPVPACFIQGTRDRLCPLNLLRDVLSKRRADSTLHVVETGNHSLEATKTHLKEQDLTQNDLEAEALEVIEKFVAKLGATPT